jgi:hypothetical protein
LLHKNLKHRRQSEFSQFRQDGTCARCLELDPFVTIRLAEVSLICKISHSRGLQSLEGSWRYGAARRDYRQDLQTPLRCHMAAFQAIGGVPIEILYDRMKTAVNGRGSRGPH